MSDFEPTSIVPIITMPPQSRDMMTIMEIMKAKNNALSLHVKAVIPHLR